MRKAILAVGLGVMFGLISACAQMSQLTAPTSTALVLDRIQERGELIVGTAGSMPPFNMTTKDGRVIGLEPDLAKYMASTMGVELKVETMPFSELLGALEAGKVDMVLSDMTMTPKRNLKVAFVGPYYVSGKGILTKKEKLASAKESEALDKSGISLAALDGSTSMDFVKSGAPHATLVPVKSYDEGVDMVIQGKVDAMVADHPICLISVHRYPEQELLALISPLTFEPIGIALPANDPLLINWVENFLRNMDGSGMMTLLYAKWLGNVTWLDELP